MFKKLLDSGHKEMKKCSKIADKILLKENEIRQLTDEQLKEKTLFFKEELQKGKTLDDILVDAYAVVREAAYRVTGLLAYHVQLIGACAIHGGNIAEMKTGEGKTLTAVFPAYLNALTGNGVHIVTVNEYLASREANGEIGDIYRFLGLTVGLNLRDLSREEKQEAYKCDILYSTNSELGFDYLRDHMVAYKQEITQRELNYAIIDEVDSILIDEARTPLIISGGAIDKSIGYIQADTFAKRLKEEDYDLDLETKTIVLTESGILKAEKFFSCKNIYDINNSKLLHHINNALKANYVFHEGVEYVVSNGEVLIVDQFTGRILKGRQYSEGLHQAIEAKEGVEIKKETVTVATITYQNYFRMYKKLSGMTGTAKTEEEEFRDIYNMYVVEIPTNKRISRIDKPDLLFLNKHAKFEALIEEIKVRHEIGQPILVGTANVETSELVSQKLSKIGLKHEVLNAKNNEREAEIIAQAGQRGAITISTNMAGRGTDIKLGEGIQNLSDNPIYNGLCVFGTERHESRRIDNQLRGRSGRQGDPGFSQFYISAEDDLLIRFGGESFKQKVAFVIKFNSGGDLTKPLESKMFTKIVTNAQTRIEGNNYDSRKNVLRYDDVIRRQREIFYKQRKEVITKDSVYNDVTNMFKDAIRIIVDMHITQVGNNKFDIDDDAIVNAFNNEYFGPHLLSKEEISTLDENQIEDLLYEKAIQILDSKKQMVAEGDFEEVLKAVLLRTLDSNWTSHIDIMDGLRQGVTLQSYGQQNPLQIYQQEGFKRFNELLNKIKLEVLRNFMRVQIKQNIKREDNLANTTTNEVVEERKKEPIKSDKIGRNDPCPCGSGLKYKYCCGKKQ